MGKILIIRGASYTPPSGSGSQTPVIPDDPDPTPVTPDPPQSSTPYQVFYSTDNEIWTLEKPSGGIKSVGLVVADRFEADIEAISYAHSDDLGTAYLCRMNTVIQVVDGAFSANASSWNDMESLPTGRYDFPNGARAVMLWLHGSSAMSSSQIETRLNAAKESVTWITG